MSNFYATLGYMDSDLEELILEKTEGIPFFIEEFIKSLMELKIIEKKGNRYYLVKGIKDVIVPSTVQDVIMARVDSLPDGAKGVLQTISVAGREFGQDGSITSLLMNQIDSVNEKIKKVKKALDIAFDNLYRTINFPYGYRRSYAINIFRKVLRPDCYKRAITRNN